MNREGSPNIENNPSLNSLQAAAEEALGGKVELKETLRSIGQATHSGVSIFENHGKKYVGKIIEPTFFASLPPDARTKTGKQLREEMIAYESRLKEIGVAVPQEYNVINRSVEGSSGLFEISS